MLTGDNEGTAKAVSSKIGIDKYYASLLPEDKVKILDRLFDISEHVAMVGDGVNDAPALARSNLGIAMGSAGSDVAIETADIALMHDDISKVNYLINLSKRTMSIVRQNFSVSILIKWFICNRCCDWTCFIMDGCCFWRYGINSCCDIECFKDRKSRLNILYCFY